MNCPDKVKLVEVGPRDGLQNEAIDISVALRVELVNRLTDCGIPVIEAGSFVSPKWVPQMANTDMVLAGISKRPEVSYPVLVPNLKGLEGAIASGVKEIAIFGAATEEFSYRNINCSINESLKKFRPVVEGALSEKIKVRGYLSVVLGCPIAGEVRPAVVADIARELLDIGCYEISLGDTIGTGTPLKTKKLIEAVGRKVPVEQIAGHFHDTYGQALVNILASLESGVSIFDSSVAGLGGCPFAGEGATGNVATEDVLYMLNGMGIQTGIDLNKVAQVGKFICKKLNRSNSSKVGKALLNFQKGIESRL